MIERVVASNGVGTISLSRAGHRNAISIAMWQALTEAVSACIDDEAVRVIILRSAVDGVFSPGADISEFPGLAAESEQRSLMRHSMAKAIDLIEQCPKPVIATIDGICIGAGCAIALACDIRIATPASRFAITPAKLGLVYSLSDTRRLVQAVGLSTAKRLLFTGDMISAETALASGLLDFIHPQLDINSTSIEMATRIAANSASTHAATKRAMDEVLDGKRSDDAVWQRLFEDAFTSSETKASISSFLGSRR